SPLSTLFPYTTLFRSCLKAPSRASPLPHLTEVPSRTRSNVGAGLLAKNDNAVYQESVTIPRMPTRMPSALPRAFAGLTFTPAFRSEEHTSELQSRFDL